MTLTSNSFLLRYCGSAPTTSARPPVFIKGTLSEAANSIFFIVFSLHSKIIALIYSFTYNIIHQSGKLVKIFL